MAIKSAAETPGDALREFVAKKALFEKAVAGFGGVETLAGGTRVGPEVPSTQAFMSDSQAQTAPKFEVSEIMTLALAATGPEVQAIVDLIEEALDVDGEWESTGSDPLRAIYLAQAGKAPEESTAIRYLPSEEVLANAETAAMKLAFEDARSLAEAAASIAGVKIGRVEAIHVLEPFEAVSPRSGSAEGVVRVAIRFAIL